MSANSSGQEDFVQHDVVDQQHQGMVAYTFQHPPGWQAESRVVWNYQYLHVPLMSFGRVVNPDALEMFEFLPSALFIWTEPNYGFSQPGQNQEGVVHMPPMSGTDACTLKFEIVSMSGINRRTNPVPISFNDQRDQIKQSLYQGAMAKIDMWNRAALSKRSLRLIIQIPPAAGAVLVKQLGLARCSVSGGRADSSVQKGVLADRCLGSLQPAVGSSFAPKRGASCRQARQNTQPVGTPSKHAGIV